MALYTVAELRSLGIGRDEDDNAFTDLVQTVTGRITEYVNEHAPEADRAAILDSALARTTSLLLVRLYLTRTAVVEDTYAGQSTTPRELRIEEPRLLRRLVGPSSAFPE